MLVTSKESTLSMIARRAALSVSVGAALALMVTITATRTVSSVVGRSDGWSVGLGGRLFVGAGIGFNVGPAVGAGAAVVCRFGARVG